MLVPGRERAEGEERHAEEAGMRGRVGENKIREQKEGGDHFCHGEAHLQTNRLP